MTPRTWAERKVSRYDYLLPDEAARLILAEHQRAVRILKRLIKSYNHFLELTDDEVLKARWRTRIGVCVDVLAALERGRGKGGKG